MDSSAVLASAVVGDVVIVGLGTVGSFAAELVARLPGLQRLVLIDHDQYEAQNIATQAIRPQDVGLPKAIAQAERVSVHHPTLPVLPVVSRAEDLPLGVFRAAVVLSCVDSRASRLFLNAACSRLRTAWIDAGVQADGRLARVNAYRPADDGPCLECAFADRDYELIEQTYPCAADAAVPPPTNAPASLGALAAAMQALECEKILSGRFDQTLVGRQAVIDTAWHKHYVTAIRRTPTCRFDHASWHVDVLDAHPDVLTVAEMVAGTADVADSDSVELRVAGQMFVRKLTCAGCGAARYLSWRVFTRIGAERNCPGCGRRMVAAGFDLREWLRAQDLGAEQLAQPLSALGVCAGDIVIRRSIVGERFLQIGIPDVWRCDAAVAARGIPDTVSAVRSDPAGCADPGR
jgi:molybdopterin/thiamine biosynthesis adenylyltransferase